MTIDNTTPKQMTTPMGIQSGLREIIIGNTPKAVVAEVRKMGLIRRLPAFIAASFVGKPSSTRSVSAYSYMTMPFRMMIPIKLTIPNQEVIPKSRPKSHSPKKAPNMHNALEPKVRMAKFSFLK